MAYATDPAQLADSDRLKLAVSREMRTGERLQWQGLQLARLSARSFAIYFFAIPWTVFSLFWTGLAAAGVASFAEEGPGLLGWAFPLFGVPFILIGLWMLSQPFAPLFQRGKVIYAVTSERLLKVSVGRSIDVKSLPAYRIGQVERIEQRDGSGSLKIAVGVTTDSDGDRTTEYFELGEVSDILDAHDAVADLGAKTNALRQRSSVLDFPS